MRNRTITIIIFTLLILTTILIYIPENETKGTNVSGTVSGVWNVAGSPYMVTADTKVLTGTILVIDPLEDKTTYYWTVIPYLDNFRGDCVDLVWNFSINLNFTFIFGVELNMSPDEFVMDAGDNKTVNFTIKNVGNVVDKFYITISFIQNEELINFTVLEVNNITLQTLNRLKVNLTFNIPKSYNSGNDTMMIIAASILGPATASLTRNITIIGKKAPPIPTEDVVAEIPSEYWTLLMIILAILIVILIVFIIFAWVVFTRLKQTAFMRYPVKPKVIVRRSRKLASNEDAIGEPSVQKDEPQRSSDEITRTNKVVKSERALPKTDPSHSTQKTSKISSVTPIRITSLHGLKTGLPETTPSRLLPTKDHKDKTGTDDEPDSISDSKTPAPASRKVKLMAKTVVQATAVRHHDDTDKTVKAKTVHVKKATAKPAEHAKPATLKSKPLEAKAADSATIESKKHKDKKDTDDKD